MRLNGKYSDVSDDSLCSICTAGKYNLATGSISFSACADCPVGRYSVEYAALGTCNSCTPGKANPNKGSTFTSAYVDCSVGKYVETEGAKTYLYCQVGKINPSTTGAASFSMCQDCGVGTGSNPNFVKLSYSSTGCFPDDLRVTFPRFRLLIKWIYFHNLKHN